MMIRGPGRIGADTEWKNYAGINCLQRFENRRVCPECMHSVHSETDSIENEINSKLKILLKEKIQKIEKIGIFILKFLPNNHPCHSEGLSDRIRLVEEGYHEMH
jgi:hypothetical protein